MMYHYEPLTIWAVSVGVVVPIVAVLAVCICGCKKTVPKNELLGLAGMVKLTNPEETLSPSLQMADEGGGVNAEATDANRRTSTTANRSLPDIPVDSERLRLEVGDTLWEGEPNGDTSSELYATVEENKHVLQPLVSTQSTSRASKRLSMRDSNPDEGKSSEHSSLSHADDGCNPYARLKAEHPYDRLKKSEHPYAQVGANAEAETSDAAIRRSDSDPVPPPRTRKSSQRSSQADSDIPAATAIAGRVAASQELPYMTPPVSLPMAGSGPSTGDFSGDSQDSKGYTSISVREPLATIQAQTKASRARQLLDSHYATVSDDSDEMYAAIDEPNQVYTSGSETYAQIQPAPAPAPIPVAVPEPAPSEPLGDDTPFPPQPPSVDSLKHVAQVHSRQASSSSATSSVANLGSPKPEKRQANSPLPPPPPGGLMTPEANLEEMYAKVMKKKQRSPETETTNVVSVKATTDELSRSSVETSSLESLALRARHDSASSLSTESAPEAVPILRYNPGYEAVQRKPSDCDPNYEELRPQHRSEVANNLGVLTGQQDPGYEKVFSASGVNCVGVVNGDDSGEPNYESMSSEGREPGYARVKGTGGGSDTDPNYEMVQHEDPNYESVNYFEANCDPPYERLRNEEVRDSDNDAVPGYERVGQRDNTSMPECDDSERICEQLKGDNEPGYEVVGRKSTSNDVWKIGSVASEERSLPENVDSLYSHVQKNHTKM